MTSFTNTNPDALPDLHYITPDLRPLAVPISSIKFDPLNARCGHDIDALTKSFVAYNQRKPVVVNRSNDNQLEAGEGTLKTMRGLGYSHIAAVFVEDDHETAVGYALADNRTALLSEWDNEMLAGLLTALPPEVVTGFDDEAIAAVLESVTVPNFEPVTESDQGQLDELRPVICPHCGKNINE